MLNKNKEKLDVVVALLFNTQKEILIAQRVDMQQKWEFPGGKVEAGEGHEQALKRELKEELGLQEIRFGEVFWSNEHVYPNKEVSLSFYPCLTHEKVVQNAMHLDIRWVKRENLKLFSFLEGNQKLLEKLMDADGSMLFEKIILPSQTRP